MSKDFLQILNEQNEEEDAFLTDKINIQENEADEESPGREDKQAEEGSPTHALVPAE